MADKTTENTESIKYNRKKERRTHEVYPFDNAFQYPHRIEFFIQNTIDNGKKIDLKQC